VATGFYRCGASITGCSLTPASDTYCAGFEDCDGDIIDCTVSDWDIGFYLCDGDITRCDVLGSGSYAAGFQECNANISQCSVSGGAGAGFEECQGFIFDCVVTGNGASGFSDCNGVILNCLVADNGWSGMILCLGTIANCTIVGNNGGAGGGLSFCSGTVANCIVWGNTYMYYGQCDPLTPAVHCCIQDWTMGGDGNITDDPLFVSGPLGHYYLSCTEAGQAANSPCIDAGWGKPADIGIDGYTTRTDGAPDTGSTDIGCHYPD
jgi:hypothetical protein